MCFSLMFWSFFIYYCLREAGSFLTAVLSMLLGVGWKDTEIFYLKHRGPIYIDGVVVHHLHDGHTKIASNAEWDAEAQAAEDGDDITLRQAATAAIQQWRGAWRWCHRSAILCQLNIVLFFHITAIYFSAEQKSVKSCVFKISSSKIYFFISTFFS